MKEERKTRRERADLREIKAMLEARVTLADIAAVTGFSESELSTMAKAWGIAFRRGARKAGQK